MGSFIYLINGTIAPKNSSHHGAYRSNLPANLIVILFLGLDPLRPTPRLLVRRRHGHILLGGGRRRGGGGSGSLLDQVLWQVAQLIQQAMHQLVRVLLAVALEHGVHNPVVRRGTWGSQPWDGEGGHGVHNPVVRGKHGVYNPGVGNMIYFAVVDRQEAILRCEILHIYLSIIHDYLDCHNFGINNNFNILLFTLQLKVVALSLIRSCLGFFIFVPTFLTSRFVTTLLLLRLFLFLPLASPLLFPCARHTA